MGCNCKETRLKLRSEIVRGDLGAAAKTAVKGAKDIAAHAARSLKPPAILRRPVRRIP